MRIKVFLKTTDGYKKERSELTPGLKGLTLILSSVEDNTVFKKVKAKKAKAKKAAAAVQTREKGKTGPVRTSGRKTKISRDLDMDFGKNEEEIDFPPKRWLRSGQI